MRLLPPLIPHFSPISIIRRGSCHLEDIARGILNELGVTLLGLTSNENPFSQTCRGSFQLINRKLPPYGNDIILGKDL